MNTPTFSLRLNVELTAKLRTLSAETGISVAKLIEACVARAIPYVESKARESKQS